MNTHKQEDIPTSETLPSSHILSAMVLVLEGFYLIYKAPMTSLYYRHLCEYTWLVITSKFPGAQFQQENGRKNPVSQGVVS